MAIMIPINRNDFNNSIGEESVYYALWKKLPDDFIVLHSVNWKIIDDSSRENNGEADFLVFNPKYGFLSIEVKSGGIERSIGGEWWTTGADGVKKRLKRSPMEQAWESANVFNAKIANSTNENIKQYKVKPVVWLTGLGDKLIQGAYGDDFVPGNTFSRADLRNPLAAIKRAYKNYGFTEKAIELTTSEIRAIVAVFSAEFNIVSRVAISESERNKIVFNRLTNEQTKLLNYIDTIKQARIEGVGGTGKTMIALEKARRIPQDEQILFLCFNKFLLNSLRDNHSESMPNVKFVNLNEFYAEKTGNDEIAEKSEIASFLKSISPSEFEFKHIIIDEGQDLEAEYLDELLRIANSIDGVFYIFYDENQLVHQWNRGNLEWFNKCGLPKLHLSVNCRNTMSIAATAYRPVGIEDIELSTEAPGEKPVLKIVENTNNVPQIIGETIREYTDKGFTKKQIVILTIKTLAKSILSGSESVSGYRLSVDDPNGKNILFTTARKFKGLEADAIIVIDVDRDCFKDDNAKSVFYVATSRAINNLTIIANIDQDDMKKIIEDLGVEQTGSPSRLIEENLSVRIEKFKDTENDNEKSRNEDAKNAPLACENPAFIQSVKNSGYNKNIVKFLLDYYMNHADNNEPINPEDAKKWLKSMLIIDDSNVKSTIIQEAIKWPFYSNRFMLEFCILLYLDHNGGIYAQNISDILYMVVDKTKLSNTMDGFIRSFLNDYKNKKIIVIDKIGIGKPSHYII